MPISPITRLFGTRIPPAYKLDIEVLNAVAAAKFGRYLSEIEKVVFLGTPLPGSKVNELTERAAKTAEIGEDAGRVVFRLYTTYIPFVASSTDETTLRDLLEGSGIEPAHAALLAKSLFPHRDMVQAELHTTLSERFGPTVSRLFWRIDQPVGGTEPVVREPIAKVTFVLETATDTFDEGFEADLATLDLVIEELTNARRELAKANERAGQ